MADEDLVIRAAIRDELSAPLAEIRNELREVRKEADRAGEATGRAGAGLGRLTAGVNGLLSRLRGGLAAGLRMTAAGLRTVAVGAGLATAALTVAAGAAVGFGVKTAASMEQAQIAFTTMLGSAQEAQKFLSDLQALAATTPFEFPDLVKGSQRLLAMGFAARDVIPTLTAIGDAVAGLGGGAAEIQQVVTAIGQMQAKGKVQGDELLQLTEVGIPALRILAAQYGVTTAEMEEMVSAGKVAAEDAIPKLIKGIEEGTKSTQAFAGMMQAQSKSLAGMWSTFRDTWGMGLSRMLEPSMPVLKALLKVLTDVVGAGFGRMGAAMRDLGPLFDRLGEAIPRVAQAIGNGNWQQAAVILDNATLAGGRLINTYQWATTTVANLRDRAGELVDRLRDAGVFDQARSILEDLGTVLRDVVLPAVSDVSAALGGSGPLALVTVAGAAGTVLDLMADHTDAAKVTLEALITALALYKIGQVGASVAMGIWNGLLLIAKARTAAVATAQWIHTAAMAVNTAAFAVSNTTVGVWLGLKALEVGAWLRSAVVTGAATVALWAHNAAMLAVRGATLLWTGAQWLLNAALTANPIGLVIVAIAALVAGVILAYKKSETFRTIVNALWGAVKVLWQQLGNAVKAIGDWFTKTENGQKVMAAARAAWDGLKASVSAVVDALKAAWEWAGKVVGALSKGDWGKLGQLAGLGDTPTARGHGRGNLAYTLAAHQAISASLGGGYRVTNALVGGGGMGRGSGDHQAGRAVDVVGRNLPAYAKAVRGLGGYAAIHGQGKGRHVHAVMGDTPTSRARPIRHSALAGGGQTVVIEQGAVVVQVVEPRAELDVEAAVERAIRRILRDAAERR